MNVRFLVLVALAPLALLLQATDLARLPFFGWRLDGALVLAMVTGLLYGPRVGLFYGLFAGACQDLILGAGVLYTATKAMAGCATGLIRPQLFRFDVVSMLMMGFGLSAFENVMVALFLALQGRSGVLEHLAALILPLSLAMALLLPLVHAAISRLPGSDPESGRYA